MSLSYRPGILNRKIISNSARSVTHRREDNNRVRFLTVEEKKKLRNAIEGQVVFVRAGARSGDQHRYAQGPSIQSDVGHGRL